MTRWRATHRAVVLLTVLAMGTLSGSVPARARCLTLALPAYFDPADARTWERLAAAGHLVSLAILNPNSGPGAAPDLRFRRLAGALRAKGIRVLGYVPTGYGSRPQSDVLADVERYREWYGISDTFLDEAASDRTRLPVYRAYTDAVRRHGGLVAMNPGTVPDRGYAALADVLITFEGSAEQYRRAPAEPGWLAGLPRDRIWHLVHSTPPQETQAVIALARDRQAGRLYVTEGRLPQPWDHLPQTWPSQLAQASDACSP